MVRLLTPKEMPPVAGFQQPLSLYTVIDTPAALAGMPYPAHPQWGALHAASFHWIVCLTEETPAYCPRPLQILFAAPLQDLWNGADPSDPAREERFIRDAVDAIITKLAQGDGVVVHCQGGRGRTGTVLGCVIVRLGLAPKLVVEYLHQIHCARGKPGWPEAAWQAALLHRFA